MSFSLSDRHSKRQKDIKQSRGREQRQKYDVNSSILLQNFSSFQKELDCRYDKRERIVKLNRDITIASKRLIFQLHRSSDDEEHLPKLLQDAHSKVIETKGFLEKIAMELVDDDPYKLAAAYSGGIQEYVEAVTFYNFIRDNTLLSYEDFCKMYLSDDKEEGSKASILLTHLDYILGVADLTGELMRLCVNCIGVGNHEKCKEICNFLREVHRQFLLISGRGLKDLKDKAKVLKQSLEKVEAACYAVHVRGSEVPTHLLVDLINQRDASHEVDEPANEQS